MVRTNGGEDLVCAGREQSYRFIFLVLLGGGNKRGKEELFSALREVRDVEN